MLCLCPPTQAATLRAQANLETPDVHVSDLFDDAGPQAGRVLGSAPAPGNQLIVEAAQLAAIARQYAVTWRPQSGAERVVLERPGRPLPHEDAVAALRRALPGSSNPDQFDIDLQAYAPPMVPADATVRTDAEQLDYDPSSGRFAALLVVTGERMNPIHARITGRAFETIELPLATRRILPGELLSAADLRPGRVRGALVRSEVVETAAAAVGLQARRSLAAGQPIAMSDIQVPNAVRKNTTVVITLSSPGMAVTALGQALDSGPIGGHIRVLNPTSRGIIEAEITGTDQVSVAVGGFAAHAGGTFAVR